MMVVEYVKKHNVIGCKLPSSWKKGEMKIRKNTIKHLIFIT
jgi:hypothetical protein